MIFNLGKSSKSDQEKPDDKDSFQKWVQNADSRDESPQIDRWQDVPLESESETNEETIKRWCNISLKNKTEQEPEPHQEKFPIQSSMSLGTEKLVLSDDREVEVTERASWPDESESFRPSWTESRTMEPEYPMDTVEEPEPPKAPLDNGFGTPKTLPHDPNLTLDEDIRRRFGGNLHSALGPGTVIEGTFSFDSPVCIDGELRGEVCSSSALIVGSQALVQADIRVGSLIILGQVTGPVAAEDLIEIRDGGRLDGEITTRRIAIERGGFFQGRCNMSTQEG